MLIGLTYKGKMISVITAKKGLATFYPVTARSASVKERRIFRREREWKNDKGEI